MEEYRGKIAKNGKARMIIIPTALRPNFPAGILVIYRKAESEKRGAEHGKTKK